MKRGSKGSIVIIMTGLLTQIYYCYPWIRGGEHTYTGLTWLSAVFREGGAAELVAREFPLSQELGGNAGAFALQFTGIVLAVTIAQLLTVATILAVFSGRLFKLGSTIALVLGGACCMIIANPVAPDGVFIGNREILSDLPYIYPYFLVVAAGIFFLVLRAVEAWDEGTRRMHKDREERKAYRQERRRRLYFPGRYSRLYYQILWKDLKYRFKDMMFLFLSVWLSGLFWFLGFGIYQMFSGNYGEDGGLLGLGLVEIMRDFLVAIAFLGLFLIIAALSFYQKRKLAGSGLIKTLGIRKKTFFWSSLAELLGCFAAAYLCAAMVGTVLLFFLRNGFAAWMPEYENAGFVSFFVAGWSLVVLALVCFVAYLTCMELGKGYGSTDTRGAAVRWEKPVGRSAWVTVLISVAAGAACFAFYGQRRMGEKLLLVCGILLCVMLMIRSLWGIWLRMRQKRQEAFLPKLTKEFRIRCRFRTMIRYVSMLMFLNVFVMMVFSVKFISSQIADEPEALYPYDYVYLANSQDEAYFEALQQECEAEVLSFPMVRATTLDATEQPEEDYRVIVVQQGQNIGISESTYRELKKLTGEKPRDLMLDEAGEKIHVVYQQDQASKARPLDWYLCSSRPYVHIGQALMGHNYITREQTYPPREIVSEEREALTGAYRQGRYENLIVFSDTYFESVKNCWKTTDLLTGEPVSEEEAVPDVTIHEWPTRLMLVNVPEKYQERADEILGEFRKSHAFDEAFDPLVKSAYISADARHQRETERQMETIVNGIVLLMLLAVEIFLLRMKMKMDLPELRRDYRFFEVFGMSSAERIRLMKREVSRYVWVPLILAGVSSFVLTGVVFGLRMYEIKDVQNYLKYGILLWGGYILAQAVNLKLMQRSLVRDLEGTKTGRNKK